MSRSLAVAASGGKTQLTGYFSSVLLVFVLLWIGPLFEQLPKVN
jgi:MFS superfamily sulfate permease-like transporter